MHGNGDRCSDESRGGSRVVSSSLQCFDSWCEWLSRRPWRWYFTGTFRDSRGRSIDRLCDRVVEWLWRDTGRESLAFLCGEYGRQTGRFHVHGLISGDADGRNTLYEQWRDRYGRPHVRNYDARRGAAAYVGKYVLKDAHDTGQYAISGAGALFHAAGWDAIQSRPFVKVEREDECREKAKNEENPIWYEKAFGEKTAEVEEKIAGSWADSWWIDHRPMSGYDRYLQEKGGSH